MDLSHLTYDQMDFIAERKAQGSAFKYTTYKGWLFGKGWQYFDESTNKVVWPERLTPVMEDDRVRQGDCGAGLVKQKPLPRLRKPTSKVGLTNEERR